MEYTSRRRVSPLDVGHQPLAPKPKRTVRNLPSKFTKNVVAVSLVLLAFFSKRAITNSIWVFESLAGLDEQNILQEKSSTKPKGVFVFKVSSTEKLEKTLCTLNVFFNENEHYPIRIFTDHLSATDDTIMKFAGNADVKIILNERWKQLPPSLTQQERKEVLAKCQNFNDPEKARCTSRKVGLGYIFNTYWSYMEMADEPELQEYDYFVLFDNDAFLTAPIQDPFKIMHQNDLVGIYNIESMEAGLTGGIQEAAENSFSLEERKNAFLHSSQFPIFDENGQWGGKDPRKPGVWMCFFGGRLDFLRSKRFKEFAQQLPFHTYTTRTSRQAVIPVGWSVLVGGDKVWYLPKRGIDMGVYHHGWVDDSEIIVANDGIDYRKNTLTRWQNFSESKVTTLVKWKEYMESQHNVNTTSLGTHQWQQCVDARGSKYGS
jgi:hypothetical protein